MKTWIAAVIASVTATAALAQSPGQIVQERRDGLRRMGAHMEAIQAHVQRGGDPREMIGRIDDAVSWYGSGFTARFPQGTAQGTPGLETRALPAIWSDFAGFERADQNQVAAFRNLRLVADTGDRAAFQTAFQTAGQTCGGCHRPYRAAAR